MIPTVTIIIVPAKDPDSFEGMYIDERRNRSGGWETFPVRSGRYLCTFLMKATGADLGVFGCEERVNGGQKLVTRVIFSGQHLRSTLPDLKALVETKAKNTALALCEHGGGKADLARVSKALKTGTWPKNGDPAEEAAAFAHHLLKSARAAKKDEFRSGMGVCWEYRGKVKV